MAVLDDDPDHPILPDVDRWRLIEFTYRRDSDDWRESYIDMVFERDGKSKRLRFFAPQNLELEGNPDSFGMYIQDVSARQLEDMRVRVANFEQSTGAPRFWASHVVEIRSSEQATIENENTGPS